VNTYTTIAGTDPHPDEQHEARTILRGRTDGGQLTEGTFMMTEIGDGTFVQWSECKTCLKRVDECGCPTGPVEPDYIARWRTNRFTDSFKGRGVEPPLPLHLEQRDRVLNAAIRDLTERGYTITAPTTAPEDTAPTTAPEDTAPTTAPEDTVTTPTVEDAVAARDAQTDAVSERVDAGMDQALATLRARTQEDTSDAGF
jgi:hypothetical protein